MRIEDGRVIIVPEGSQSLRPLEVRVATGRPPRTGLLVGRDRELALVRDPPTPLVVVWGISGIGKTSLVAHALRDYPRVFWHTMTRMDSASYLLWRLALFLSSQGAPELLAFLGSPGAAPDLAVDVAVESLRGSGARLVFDDYHEVEGTPVAGIVARLAMEAEGYNVYVLSRTRPRSLARLPPERRTEILLTGLDLDSSLTLLEELGSGFSREAGIEAYRLTSGHPMLLTLIARAGGLGLEDVRRATVQYVWDEVYGSLSPREKRILSVLSGFEEPIPLGLVAHLTGLLDPLPYLQRLRDKGIVEVYESGFRAHQLIRSLLGPGDRKHLYAKAAGYYESTGSWPEQIRAMHYYLRAGSPDKAAEIVARRVREDDYRYIRHLHAYASILETLSQQRISQELAVYVRHDLVIVYKLQSRLTTALRTANEALIAAEMLRDLLAEASLRSERSYILSELGRPYEALSDAEKAVSMARELGVPTLLLGALANLARAQVEVGLYNEALDTVREEAKVASVIGDPFYIIWSMLHIAEASHMAGHREEAKRYVAEAYRLAESLGLIHPQFFACLGYSAILVEEERWKDLLEWASRAEKLLNRLGLGHRSSRPRYYRARALAGLGRREEALLEARWALELAEQSEDREIAEAARSLIDALSG